MNFVLPASIFHGVVVATLRSTTEYIEGSNYEAQYRRVFVSHATHICLAAFIKLIITFCWYIRKFSP